MYNKKTNLIIGFHGCDKSIRDAVINGNEENLRPSINSYDWLGNGIYFWESDPVRAFEWAKESASRKSSSIKSPSVLGAVIDLGNCLDLMSRQSIQTLQQGYKWVQHNHLINNSPMPINMDVAGDSDLLLRYLDCAVIQKIHEIANRYPNLGISPFDSVRGLFLEGPAAYEGSGFREKTHIQLCVINPNCIKGYFLPRQLNYLYSSP